MELILKGKGSLNKRDLEESIPFMMKLMNSHRMLNNISLEIIFEKLQNGEKGNCQYIEKNEFEIRISNKLNRKESFLVLAHELVHVKQFFRKELKFHFDKAEWKGKIYNLNKVHYYDMPWEIEAAGREFGLVYRFAEHKNSLKKATREK